MVRSYFIGGNWKCNGTLKSIQDLCTLLNKIEINQKTLEVIIAPSSLHLFYVKSLLQNHDIAICAQNVSLTGIGAYTGEIAAEQLVDMGLNWTITGHSERRAYYHETDEIVAQKTKRALDGGLHVIFCIGESLEERQANETMNVLIRQLQAVCDIISQENWAHLVIAYEPVWAIGTGVVATPAQAQEVHQDLRAWIAQHVSRNVADRVRIIYGGSVKGENCHELIALDDVDGFLVGGAALKPEFKNIIQCALK
ncbi:unnamed protein product [Peronospora belbahrii]|uniref:Triosephosphate isomerase n=1 Tax=Peronospora belbahrii TaxID=622444 RepID=A0AAU9KMB8_9STRA|nr:unnamed protein product [Peronospora belbahrii]CAH0518582.1 unnamed protein product [Peronospora belbahrii]